MLANSEPISRLIENFLFHCRYEKNLSPKTLKAYRTDLNQYLDFLVENRADEAIPMTKREFIKRYVQSVSERSKPKTLQRKVATLKTFFNHLEFEDIITINPFRKLRIKIKACHHLPRTIELPVIQRLFSHLYGKKRDIMKRDMPTYRSLVRDIAVLELLFSTGMRVSELCNLRDANVDIESKTLLVLGKGNRERLIPLCSQEPVEALKEYYRLFNNDIKSMDFFFLNRHRRQLSSQSVRFMIRKYTIELNLEQKITPHMFRHSLATLLLENEVDIRYIQQLLGHSSINTTQIYAHVNHKAQRRILTKHHPRKYISSGGAF